MFIVPFFLRAPIKSIIQWNLVPITLFLENHGKGLCSAESGEEWLSENGFVKKQSWQVNDIYFVEIDTEKTNLKEFYSFEQITFEQKKGTEECWRTFFVMKSVEPEEKSSEKAWNENLENPFSKILLEIRTKMNL
jgi:hypothetical protein